MAEGSEQLPEEATPWEELEKLWDKIFSPLTESCKELAPQGKELEPQGKELEPQGKELEPQGEELEPQALPWLRGRQVYKNGKLLKSSCSNSVSDVKEEIYAEDHNLLPNKQRLFRQGKEVVSGMLFFGKHHLVYGDEIAVHILYMNNDLLSFIDTVGVKPSETVRTLEEIYKSDSTKDYVLTTEDGEVLEPHRTLSSYNITDNSVLVWKPRPQRSFIISFVENFKAFAEVLKNAVGMQKESIRELLKSVGVGSMEHMVKQMMTILRSGKKLPEDLKQHAEKLLNPQQLLIIACAIGINWELVGTALGLHQVQIEHVKMDNEGTKTRIFKMLNEWNITDTAARAGKLLRVLWENQRSVSVNWAQVLGAFG